MKLLDFVLPSDKLSLKFFQKSYSALTTYSIGGLFSELKIIKRIETHLEKKIG